MPSNKVFNLETGEHQKKAPTLDTTKFWSNFFDGSPSKKEFRDKEIERQIQGISNFDSKEAIRLTKLG